MFSRGCGHLATISKPHGITKLSNILPTRQSKYQTTLPSTPIQSTPTTTPLRLISTTTTTQSNYYLNHYSTTPHSTQYITPFKSNRFQKNTQKKNISIFQTSKYSSTQQLQSRRQFSSTIPPSTDPLTGSNIPAPLPPPSPSLIERLKSIDFQDLKRRYQNTPKSRRRRYIRRFLLSSLLISFIYPTYHLIQATRFVDYIEGYGGWSSYAERHDLMDLYELPLQLDKPLIGELSTYDGQPLIEDSFPKVHKILLRNALIERELTKIGDEALETMKYYCNLTGPDGLLPSANGLLPSANGIGRIGGSGTGEQNLRSELNDLYDELRNKINACRMESICILYFFGQHNSVTHGKPLSRVRRALYPRLFTRSFELIQATKLLLKQTTMLCLYINSMQSPTWKALVPKEYQSLFGYHQFMYFAGRAIAKRQASALHQLHLNQELISSENAEKYGEIYEPQDPPIIIPSDFPFGPNSRLAWEPLFEALEKNDNFLRENNRLEKKFLDNNNGIDNDDNDNDDIQDKGLISRHDILDVNYQRKLDEKNGLMFIASAAFYAPILTKDEILNLSILPIDVVIDPTQLPSDKFNFNYLPPTEADFNNILHYRRYTDYPDFLWRYTPAIRIPYVKLGEFLDRTTATNDNKDQDSRRLEQQRRNYTSPTLSRYSLTRLPRPDPIKYNPHNDAATLTENFYFLDNLRKGSAASISSDLRSFAWTLRYGHASEADKPIVGTFLQVPYKDQMIIGEVQPVDILEQAAIKPVNLTPDRQQEYILNYHAGKTKQ